MKKEVKRGQIYYADLSPAIGSEQGGLRPVLIVQNDKGNQYSPTTIVVPITSVKTKSKIPTHHYFEGENIKGFLLCEQVKVIDKSRLKEYCETLDEFEMNMTDKRLRISLGL